MNLEALRIFCLTQPAATEDMPFDENTLCFKVGGKIFALTNLNGNPLEINLKCDPEKAAELREQHDCIKPGFHMNKKHWNTITIDGSVSNMLLREWITDSYELVFRSLPKILQKELEGEKE
jgi:predicted DNA-binding protein (MmcQ/YjbR family)